MSASDMDEAFPNVNPQHRPFGGRVLLQLRVAKSRSRGGIILPEETRQSEHQLTTIAKVVRLGDGAFKNRTTGEPWPEGAWAKVGDFVRIQLHGGRRFSMPIPGRQGETVTFVELNDYELSGQYEGDPLEAVAYV